MPSSAPSLIRALLLLACLASLSCSGLAAATVESIVVVAGGGHPSDPLQRGIQSATGVAVAPDGTLYWNTGKQIMHRLATGQSVVVAGSDAWGDTGDGALATAAVLTTSGSIAFDAVGNLYIACNTRVRKIAAGTGIITTVAGIGTYLSSGDGGPATSAEVSPHGLAVDTDGNLFISDYYNHRIRRVDAGTGIITTYAGTGSFGWNGDGLVATATQVNYPSGIALDAAGNLFIADSNNYRIRRVDAVTKIVSTVAGNGLWGFSGDGGAATSASIKAPYGVVVDGNGNLSIADEDNHRIRKVTQATGYISTYAGSNQGYLGDGGSATAAWLSRPRGLALDADGNLYFCDFGNHRIREVIATSQNVVTIAGNGSDNYSGDGGPALAATLSSPSCVIFDASDNQYIVDQNNNRIRKVTKSTGIITTIAGTGEYGFSGDGGQAMVAKLAMPSSIAFDNAGDLLITDQYNHRLRKVTMSTGVITTIAGSGPASPNTYGTHEGDGGVATAARLNQPEYVIVAPNGDIYLSDMQNQRIAKIATGTNIITTIAGDGANRTTAMRGVSGFSGDGGPATSARFDLPTCLRLDSAGNLYVADCANSRIRVITASDGKIATIAGGGATLGDGGLATSARLNYPTSMVFNTAGDLFIADQVQQRIRRVDHSTKIITTVAGTGVAGFVGNGGPAILAQLNSPTGVAFDHAGQLFLTERYVNMIRKLVTLTVPEITWNPQPLVYGNGLGSAQHNASSTIPGTFAYGQAPGTVPLATGTMLLTATFTPGNAAYATMAPVANVTVTPAPLAVVADDCSKASGAANPALSYHLAGLVNGDTDTVLSGSPVLTTTATTGSPVGTYPITVDVGSVTATNYTVTGSAGTLTVTTAGGSPPPSSSGGSGGCGLGSGVAVLLLLMASGLLALSRNTRAALDDTVA